MMNREHAWITFVAKKGRKGFDKRMRPRAEPIVRNRRIQVLEPMVEKQE